MEPDCLVRDACTTKIVPVYTDKKRNDEPGKDHPPGFAHVGQCLEIR